MKVLSICYARGALGRASLTGLEVRTAPIVGSRIAHSKKGDSNEI